MDRQSIAAVIPAFNEEKHIGDVVRRTRAKLDHVLVVDDSSSDATASEARTAGADVIAHSENRGKGEARSKATSVARFMVSPNRW